MAIGVQTNVASLVTQNHLTKTRGQVDVAMQRLASGYRLNSAGDDPGALGISESLNAQVRSHGAAERNANDGISMTQVADGVAGNIGDMLARLRELAVQSANGSLTTQDRRNVDTEFQQVLAEVDRTAASASFNGKRMIAGKPDSVAVTGTLRAQHTGVPMQPPLVPFGSSPDPTLPHQQITATDGRGGTRELDVYFEDHSPGWATIMAYDRGTPAGFAIPLALNTYFIGVPLNPGKSLSSRINVGGGLSFELTDGAGEQTFVGDPLRYNVPTANGSTRELYLYNVPSQGPGGNGFLVPYVDGVEYSPIPYTGGTIPSSATVAGIELDLSGLSVASTTDMQGSGGPLTVDFQVGINTSSSDTITATFACMTASALGLGGRAVTSVFGATTAISAVDAAIQAVATRRASFGATMNRLQAATYGLQNAETNLSAANSRIRDADVAEESAKLARAQILAQAGSSVLAQANQVPQSALQLLRG